MRKLLVALITLLALEVAHGQEIKGGAAPVAKESTQATELHTTNGGSHPRRIFVGYGQGGFITSPAIPGLADKLKPYGTVSLHTAGQINTVVGEINSLGRDHPDTRVIVFGYSLNASYLDFVCRSLNPNRWLDLGIALDPTRQYAYVTQNVTLRANMFRSVHGELATGGQPVSRAPCFKRVITFHNDGAWPFGGAVFTGANVEYYRLPWTTHLGAQFLSMPQDVTVEAVKND